MAHSSQASDICHNSATVFYHKMQLQNPHGKTNRFPDPGGPNTPYR